MSILKEKTGGTILQELAGNWQILLAATIGTSLGVPAVYYYTAGIFLGRLLPEFAWSASAGSITSTVVIATIAITSPIVGRLVDQYGALRVGTLSMLWFAAGLWALSLTDGVFWHYLLLTSALAVGASATTAVCFLRMLVSTFERARGTAIGIALAGIGVSVAFVPQVTAAVIASDGWRSGYRFLSLLLLLAVPLVLLAGRRYVPVARSSIVDSASRGMAVKEAMSTTTFWLMAAAFFTSAAAVGGSIINFVPLLVDNGMPSPTAIGIASLLGFALIVGRVITGLLLDRIRAERVAAAFFAAGAVGCGTFILPPSVSTAVAGAILLGAAMGAEVDIAGYMTARYFGLRHFSAVYGWQYGIFSIGASLGPLVVGLSVDKAGDTLPAILIFVLLLLLATGLAIALPKCGSDANGSRRAR